MDVDPAAELIRERDGRDKDRHRYRDKDRHRHHDNDRPRDKDKDRHRHRDKDKDRDNKRDGRETTRRKKSDDTDRSRSPSRLRDGWMGGDDVEYVRSKVRLERPDQSDQLGYVSQKHVEKVNVEMHDREMNRLDDDGRDRSDHDGRDRQESKAVGFVFGDSGSEWRLARLAGVVDRAKKDGRSVESVAKDVFGSVWMFDVVREEEREMDRRSRYGDGYVGVDGPIGDLHAERGDGCWSGDDGSSVGDEVVEEDRQEVVEQLVDPSMLNRLKAQLIKARLRKASNLAELEQEFARAERQSSRRNDDVLTTVSGRHARALGAMNRASKSTGKDESEMTIADMVQQERIGRDSNTANREFARRIATDGRFEANLDYLDEQAARLARSSTADKTAARLRAGVVGESARAERAMDHCRFCFRDDRRGPRAPVVAVGNRVFLTVTEEPDLIEPTTDDSGEAGGVCLTISPIAHHRNLVECDDDEWEEMRNFMKSIVKMFDLNGRQSPVFYENCAWPEKRRHAVMVVVGLPAAVAADSPAFFREAILAGSVEWSQHKPIIDTLAAAKTGKFGRWTVRKMLPASLAYVHVWFTIDGGFGHVVENADEWQTRDLFFRSVLGGMIDVSDGIVRAKRDSDRRIRSRVERANRWWKPVDWTVALSDVVES